MAGIPKLFGQFQVFKKKKREIPGPTQRARKCFKKREIPGPTQRARKYFKKREKYLNLSIELGSI